MRLVFSVLKRRNFSAMGNPDVGKRITPVGVVLEFWSLFPTPRLNSVCTKKFFASHVYLFYFFILSHLLAQARGFDANKCPYFL